MEWHFLDKGLCLRELYEDAPNAVVDYQQLDVETIADKG